MLRNKNEEVIESESEYLTVETIFGEPSEKYEMERLVLEEVQGVLKK